jgi:hypothetical protein
VIRDREECSYFVIPSASACRAVVLRLRTKAEGTSPKARTIIEIAGRLWDESDAVDPKQEQFASSALDKHDTIIRRNLGMSDNQPAVSSLNVDVLTQGRRLIAIEQSLTRHHHKANLEAPEL